MVVHASTRALSIVMFGGARWCHVVLFYCYTFVSGLPSQGQRGDVTLCVIWPLGVTKFLTFYGNWRVVSYFTPSAMLTFCMSRITFSDAAFKQNSWVVSDGKHICASVPSIYCNVIEWHDYPMCRYVATETRMMHSVYMYLFEWP